MTRIARREEGYVLFGIVVVLIIMGILLAAAVPLWQKITQREKEQELIWRGYQYMQAIERYQRKFPGAFPPNVDVLVEQKFLRKAYEDPMSEDGEWKILRQLSPELQPGGQQQESESSGITGLNRSQARMRTPGAQPSTGARAGAFRSATGQRLGAGSGDDVGMGGIVGVASKSDEETFYVVPGKEKYKDWLFVFGAQVAGAAVPGAGPVPGTPPGRAPGRAPTVAPGGLGGMGATLPPPPGNMRFMLGGPQQPGAAGAAPGAPPGQGPGIGGPRLPGGTGFGQQTPGGFGAPPGSSPLPTDLPPGQQDPRRRPPNR